MDGPGGRVRLGLHTLPVLGAFASPRTVVEANDVLAERVRGRRDAIELFATIAELCRVGALRAEGAAPAFASNARSEGFAAVPIHVAMLDDRARTDGWMDAISRVVKPGDVVLDIGTGTGVLAVKAALAGARHVYAIEASGVATAAAALAEENGVGDRITVIRGWSVFTELPERANVLVAEILDDDPFCERVLEISADARARLLTEDARIIPNRISMFVTPVEIPEDIRGDYSFTEENTERWRKGYGVRFSSLLQAFGAGFVTGVRPREAAEFRRLAEPNRIVDVELGTVERIDATSEIAITTPGRVDGLLSFFDAEVSGQVVTTDPVRDESATHWLLPTWMLAKSRIVSTGDRLNVRYRYPGLPAWELWG